jgi:selenocysteine lyase/cysteine desulfurase
MADFSHRETLAAVTRATDPRVLAHDERFWTDLARLWSPDPTFVQLNYGFYHPSMNPVLEAEIATMRELNRRGSHFKVRDSATLLEATRADVAGLLGASPEEVVITRSASEALNIVLRGFPLSAGDEVVASDQDYTAVNQALGHRVRTEGVAVRPAALPLDPTSDDEVVAAFEAQINPRTRLLVVTHMIHVTGQVLPVARLCALGRSHGVPVLVDAAHSFAQLDFSAQALGCDYLCAALHKWLGAPLGSGLLFVRQDRIGSLEPLFGDIEMPADNVRKLERFGNRPDSTFAGIREAVLWHRALGVAAKRERLLALQQSWTNRVATIPGFRVLTPRDPGRSGALGLVAHDRIPAQELVRRLMDEHNILTAVQKLPSVAGLRAVPGLPTPRGHLDRLVEALERITAQG